MCKRSGESWSRAETWTTETKTETEAEEKQWKVAELKVSLKFGQTLASRGQGTGPRNSGLRQTTLVLLGLGLLFKMSCFNSCRSAVSLKKRRYVGDGFNLDLAYITDRIIAFGFPASGKEYFYRNPWRQTKKFLNHFHGDNYKVYNLCCEKDRQYDAKRFNDQVECFPFEDHNAPPLGLIHKFCLSVDAFLKADEANVVAVHCKAGKGRTGLMICAYLVYSSLFNSPVKAMEYYGDKRTHNGKGVTIPSQKRYVKYYNTILDKGFPAARKTKLLKLYISSLPLGMETFVVVYERAHDTLSPYSVMKAEASFTKKEALCYSIEENTKKRIKNVKAKIAGSTHKALFEEAYAPELEGDIKIVVYKKKMKKKNILFSAWFNTAFIPSTNRVVAMKSDLDKVKKSLPQDLKLVLHFTEDMSVGTTRGEKLLALSKQVAAEGEQESVALAKTPSTSRMTIGELPQGMDEIELVPVRTPSKKEISTHEIEIMTPNTRKDVHIEHLETEMASLKSAMQGMMEEQANNSEDLKQRLNDATSDKRRLELELVEKTQDFASALFDMEQQLAYSKDEVQRLSKDKEALSAKVGELESVPTNTLNDIIEDLEEQNKELRGENKNLREGLVEREKSNKLIEETFSEPVQYENTEPEKTELVGSLNVSIDKMHQLMALLKKEQDANRDLNQKLQKFLGHEKDVFEIDDEFAKYIEEN